MSLETSILWLPKSDHESRALFDYETNSFGGGNRNPAGVRVDATTALNSTVVLSCVRVLAESIATLPLHIYRRVEGGGKEFAREHPLYGVLHDSPNAWQTSFEWREMQMLHLGIYGQSFNEIVRDERDIVRELIPLHPSRMRVESIETGTLRYTYQEETGRLTTYSQDQIMHIRWMSMDAVNGMVPIELAKDAIGLARACEIHGASFFANGARPGMVLSTENSLSVEAAEALRNNWERVHRGPDRAQKTAVLTGGLKPVEFGNTNQESQFLETRRFQIEEICRLYRVPPHLVGDLSRSTFANIEQQSIDFVQHTLLPWLRRFESAFKRDLLGSDDDVHFAEFDTRGFMRGDAAARASYYSTLHQLGVASVNELRAWENLNPVEGGDTRFAPLNMQTLTAAAKQPDPPQPPPTPQASVSELVAVLNQVTSGSVPADAAKAIMAAAFPALPQELAGQILSGLETGVPDKSAAGDRPSADVGGLVAVLSQVTNGSLKPDAAVAALGSVYPELSADTARQIVAGVNPMPQPPQPPERPAADVGGLLAILGQVSQGAVTPEAALSIVSAVFPSMPPDMAQAIIAGAKQQAPPQAAPAPGAEGQPPEGEQASRAFCPGASPPDNSCSPTNKGDGGKGTVPSSDYGMEYSPDNAKVVAKAREVGDDKWNELPVTTLPAGTKLQANEETLKTAPIEKVVSGKEPFREGYVTKLWDDGDGNLHIVDGHHRVAMYQALGKDMPVRIMDKSAYERLTKKKWSRAFCPGASPPDNSCSPSNKGEQAVPKPDYMGPTDATGTTNHGTWFLERNTEQNKSPGHGDATTHVISLLGNNGQTKAFVYADLSDDKTTLYINYAHVDKQYRRQGVYTSILGSLSEQFRVVSDEPHNVDLAAKKAYESLGATVDRYGHYVLEKKKKSEGRAFCPTGPGGGVDNSCSASSGKRADVSPPALRSHADKVAGGSYIDGALATPNFPNGAVVPKDPAKLAEHHARVKQELVERIAVPSVKTKGMANAATSVDELLADAREVAPKFKETVERAAKASGSEVSFGEASKSDPEQKYLQEHAFGTHMLKLPASVEGKIPRIRKEDKIPDSIPDSEIIRSNMKDAVRGTIISDTPESLGDAVRSIQKQAERDGMKVAIKNRFEDTSETGYGAVHMTLQMQSPSGRPVMTELQFHLRAAYDGNQGSPKDNSHGLYKPDPKTNTVSRQSAAAQMLIWSKAFDEVPPKPRRKASRAFCPTGDGGGVDNSCGGKEGGASAKCPEPCHEPDPSIDANKDGITDVARVGVPAMDVPPPPPIGRLPNLNERERKVEESFAEYFERDPDAVAEQYRKLVTEQDGPPTFATDDAKALTDAWSDPDPSVRAENRATLNTVLHQTANAIAKRAFVAHLDTLKPGDEILVTVGGCGAGKGYALKNVPESLAARNRAAAVWDSAGDQNATENPWVQAEAEKRGLKVSYVYVHADPKTQWADEKKGVVKRAENPNDGRMVDAQVFADSYAYGARNHQAFYEANRNNPNASFLFVDNTGTPKPIDGIPQSALSVDARELADYASRVVQSREVSERVREGALQGKRIWRRKK